MQLSELKKKIGVSKRFQYLPQLTQNKAAKFKFFWICVKDRHKKSVL